MFETINYNNPHITKLNRRQYYIKWKLPNNQKLKIKIKEGSEFNDIKLGEDVGSVNSLGGSINGTTS